MFDGAELVVSWNVDCLVPAPDVSSLFHLLSARWTLRFGPQMLGAVAATCGFIFIHHLRSRMLLRSAGRFASYVPTLFIPSVTTTVAQYGFVEQPLMDGDLSCSVCAVTRAVSIQLLAGFAQPLVLAALATSGIAKTLSIYPLPPLNEPAALLRVYSRLLRPLRSTMVVMAVTSAANAAIITHRQATAAVKMRGKLVNQNVYHA